MSHRKYLLFSDRIKLIISETGVSQAELARRLKVQRATVTEWVRGRSQTARMDIPFLIEDWLSYSARWIATGKGQVKIPTIDPTDSIIIDSLPRVANPEYKQEIRAFVDYQINR